MMRPTIWRNFANPSIFNRSLDQFFTPDYRNRLDMDSDFTPALNARENDSEYTIEIAAPGLEKEDFEITVMHDELNISVEKMHEKTRDEGYLVEEFNYTSFNRSLRLPDAIDESGINAQYEDGILRITLPKVSDQEDIEKPLEIAVN